MGILTEEAVGARAIVLDCRWLSYGGAGRATEVLLRGLSERPAEEQWILWGPPDVTEYAWPGAKVSLTNIRPNAMRGQRSWFDTPPGDLTVFMHQQRPLRKIPSVTVFYDTIPLRFARSRADRVIKHRFLIQAAAISREIVTLSEYSRRCIVRDLGVKEDRVTLALWPVDDSFADRVIQLRSEVKRAEVALFVGRFLPHKNLPRLIRAFMATKFRRAGGRLLLVGGSSDEIRNLKQFLDDDAKSCILMLSRSEQRVLDELFASSLFLVQPSLEEGFGLPVWEARTCGLPVCASDAGALPEIMGGEGGLFPATSIGAISEAIDACAERARSLSAQDAARLSKEFRRRGPTIREFAEQFHVVARSAIQADRSNRGSSR